MTAEIDLGCGTHALRKVPPWTMGIIRIVSGLSPSCHGCHEDSAEIFLSFCFDSRS